MKVITPSVKREIYRALMEDNYLHLQGLAICLDSSDEQIQEYMVEGQEIYLYAQDSSQCICRIFLGVLNDRGELIIYHFWVREKGQGQGRAWFNQVLSTIFCNPLDVHISTTVDVAGFWEKLGFERLSAPDEEGFLYMKYERLAPQSMK